MEPNVVYCSEPPCIECIRRFSFLNHYSVHFSEPAGGKKRASAKNMGVSLVADFGSGFGSPGVSSDLGWALVGLCFRFVCGLLGVGLGSDLGLCAVVFGLVRVWLEFGWGWLSLPWCGLVRLVRGLWLVRLVWLGLLISLVGVVSFVCVAWLFCCLDWFACFVQLVGFRWLP
jgi:hypothetical protein